MTPTTYSYNSYESLNAKPAPESARHPDSIFWMVIRLGSSGVTKIDAHPTREHPTYEEACAEAERLAAKHPTHARGFAVLKACRIVKAEVSIVRKNLV
ncbi:MAG: hypothetical protein EBR40_10680 [Proteobacteria bacterium]|nr:hypothetical protein [Pseudomonadota bacterium]